LIISIGHGQITGSKTLTSSGYISNSSQVAKLLLRSSFEDVTILGTNSEPYLGNFKDMSGRNVATYADLTPKDNSDGSQVWVENSATPTSGAPTPHSGTKCLGFRSNNAGSGARSCMQLTHLDGSSGMGSYSGLNIDAAGLSGDVYFSVWYYYPANWDLTVSQYWTEVVNLFELWDAGAYNPKCEIHIHHASTSRYFLELQWEGVNTGNHVLWNIFDPFDLNTIRGKWTKWSFFIHRSTDYNDAYIQFWLNDVLYGPITGGDRFTDANGSHPDGSSYHFYTKGISNPLWIIIFAKTYLDANGTYHYLWADDLEVWDGIP
jgi:hypothetical protein